MNVKRRQLLQMGAAGSLWLTGVSAARAQADPITFAAAEVGIALFNSAISRISDQLMGGIFGSGTGSDQNLDQIHTWIQNAVADLERFVTAELKAEFYAQTQVQFDAEMAKVLEALRLFPTNLAAAKQGLNVDFLHIAIITASGLVEQSLHYPQAIFVTTRAMAYELIAVNTMHTVYPHDGYILAEKAAMDNFITRVKANRDSVVAKLKPDIRITSMCGLGVVDGQPYGCKVWDNGGEAWARGNNSLPQSQHDLENQMQSELDDHRAQAQKDYDDFVKKANLSINLAIEYYNKMCNRVGKRYAAPSKPASQ